MVQALRRKTTRKSVCLGEYCFVCCLFVYCCCFQSFTTSNFHSQAISAASLDLEDLFIPRPGVRFLLWLPRGGAELALHCGRCHDCDENEGQGKWNAAHLRS
jgi:hypothetical protein